MAACDSERAGAVVLGYTEASWENLSGQERQPWSYGKPWIRLTDIERIGAALLGFTEKSWDNKSGLEPQPISYSKSWSELTVCPGGEDTYILRTKVS